MNANLKEIKRKLLRAKEDPNELLMRISMGRAVHLMKQLRTKICQCEELTDDLKDKDFEFLDDCNDQIRTLYSLVPLNAGGGKVEKDIARKYFVVIDYIIEKLDKIATCIHLKRHLNYKVGRQVTQIRNAKRLRRLRIAILKTKKAIKLNYEKNRQLKANIEALKISILALKTGKMGECPPKGTILREEPFWKKPTTLHFRCKAPYCKPNWRLLSPSLRCMLKIFKTQITSSHMFKTLSYLPTVLEYSNSDYPSYIEPPIEFQDVLPGSPVTTEEDWHVCIDDICQTISAKDSSPALEIEDIWHVYFYAIDNNIPKYEVGRVYVDAYMLASPKSIETLKIFFANSSDGEERQGQFLPNKICYFEDQCDLDRISGKTYVVGKIPESTERGAATTDYEEYTEDLQEFRIEEFQDELPDLEIEDDNVCEPPVESAVNWHISLEGNCQPISGQKMESESVTIDYSLHLECQEDIQEDSTSYKTAIDNEENWYGEECKKDIQDLNPKSTEYSEIQSPRLWMTLYLSCDEVTDENNLDETSKESPTTYRTLTTPIGDEECQDDLEEFKIEEYQNVLPDLKSNDSMLEKTPSDTVYPVNYFWMQLTFGERRQSMLHWCKIKLQGYRIRVSDFTASWKNGRAFVALLHCHHKQLIEERFLTKESAQNTLNYGAQIARSLGVSGSKDFVQECLRKQPTQFKIMPFVERLRICLEPPRC